MKLLPPQILIIVFVCICFSTKGQIFADRLLDSGPCNPTEPILCPAGVTNPEHAIDNNGANFALLNTDLGVLPDAFLEIGFSVPADPLSVVSVVLSEPNQTLTAEALQALNIRFLTDSDSVIYEINGLSLQDVQVISGEGDVFVYSTVSPDGEYTLSKIHISWSGILNVYASLGIHGAFHFPIQNFSTPAGGCLLGEAKNVISSQNCQAPQNIVDGDQSSYGLFYLPIGVLTEANVHVDVVDAQAGDFIGFHVGPNNVVLGTGVIQNLILEIYDETGTLVDSKSDFEAADIILMSEMGPDYWIGMQSPEGAYTPSSIKLRLTPTVGVLLDLRVYGAMAIDFYNRVNITATNTILCEGDQSTLSAQDGLLNYEWSTGFKAKEITINQPGYYVVSAEQSNGCKVNGVFFVADGNFSISINTDSATCNQEDGNANIYLEGGSGLFNVEWPDGDTSLTKTNLAAGIYPVQITDSDYGCVKTQLIPISDTEGPFVIGSVYETACGFATGRIEVSITGVGPFSFKWTDGSTDQNRTDLNEGVYGLVVNDFNGCKTSRIFEVNSSGNMLNSHQLTHPDCDVENGSIVLDLVPGDFSFVWSNGATTKDQFNLAAGIYSVDISNVNSTCNDSYTFVLTPQDLVNPALQSKQDESCHGNDGELQVEPIPSYEALWSTGQTGWSISNLAPGDYYLNCWSTTDSCRGYSLFRVAPYEANNLKVQKLNDCLQSESPQGKIVLVPEDPNRELSVIWSTGDTNLVLDNLSPGLYEAIVADNQGCSQELKFTIDAEDCTDRCPLEFYNFLSPNNDGINDRWIIKNLETCGDHTLYIYDRWGSQVYIASPYKNNWIGLTQNFSRELPEGTYFYVLKTNVDGGATYSGQINLLR